jgi:hypothetical protein
MKKYLLAVPPLLLSLSVQAASVFDATTKSAIETGLGDIKDTFVDLINTAFPILLAVIALVIGVKMVKRIAKMVAS